MTKRETRPGAGRRGGVPASAAARFELTGGALCLDLANTVDNRTGAARELLVTYDDLVDWAAQAGLLDLRDRASLLALAARRPGAARAVLGRVRRVREAIYAVFAATAAGRSAPVAARTQLSSMLPQAARHLELIPAARGPWAWRWRRQSLDAMLWPVVHTVGDLLTSADLSRVRECAAARCGWLFLDRSRNGSRRWCDMAVCGNRSKVRRYRSRRAARKGRAGT